jgi:hypothetical protein
LPCRRLRKAATTLSLMMMCAFEPPTIMRITPPTNS